MFFLNARGYFSVKKEAPGDFFSFQPLYFIIYVYIYSE